MKITPLLRSPTIVNRQHLGNRQGWETIIILFHCERYSKQTQSMRLHATIKISGKAVT